EGDPASTPPSSDNPTSCSEGNEEAFETQNCIILHNPFSLLNFSLHHRHGPHLGSQEDNLLNEAALLNPWLGLCQRKETERNRRRKVFLFCKLRLKRQEGVNGMQAYL
ncbi:hypothetical protein Csa_023549, partial [Cucumis sativus]